MTNENPSLARAIARRAARVVSAATLAAAALATATGARAQAAAHPAHVHALPPGPISDRHEIMEGIGRDAKAIGAAMKAGKPADAAKPASDIAAKIDPFLKLFPEGSSGQGSRAKAAVWSDRGKFDQVGADLKDKATAVAAAANSGGDVKAASTAMFQDCKSCHDQFREPDQGE
ncbi:MAG: cytochrome c [Deltaproteobacteria bacterium]